MARLQISEDDFRDAIAEIRHLSPKPGNLYAEDVADLQIRYGELWNAVSTILSRMGNL